MKKDLIKAAMNFFQNLKDNRGNHLLEADSSRPNQFRRKGTLWASPKIRVFSNPSLYPDMLLDFYNDTRNPKEIDFWNKMTEKFVQENPAWGRQKTKAAKKYYIYKKGKKDTTFFMPQTEAEVIQLCKSFYELFEPYDIFVTQEK